MSEPMPLEVSARVPGVAELQDNINRLVATLANLPLPTANVVGARLKPYTDARRKQLQQQLTDMREQMSLLISPRDQSGVPAAPEAAAVLGPRITPPKVGLNDLKILLPPR